MRSTNFKQYVYITGISAVRNMSKNPTCISYLHLSGPCDALPCDALACFHWQCVSKETRLKNAAATLSKATMHE